MMRTAVTKQSHAKAVKATPVQSTPSARRSESTQGRVAVLERSLGHQLTRRLFLSQRKKQQLAKSRDRYEVKADLMAGAVMGQTVPRPVEGQNLSSVGAERLQALCDECEDEVDGSSGIVQACGCANGSDSSVELESSSLRSGGSPLGAGSGAFSSGALPATSAASACTPTQPRQRRRCQSARGLSLGVGTSISAAASIRLEHGPAVGCSHMN